MNCILCDGNCSSCPLDPDFEELPDVPEFKEKDLELYYYFEGVQKNE